METAASCSPSTSHGDRLLPGSSSTSTSLGVLTILASSSISTSAGRRSFIYPDLQNNGRSRDFVVCLLSISRFFLNSSRGRGEGADGRGQRRRGLNSWPSTHAAASAWRTSMSKPTYCIPQPQRLRHIQHSFAWIDHRLLRSGFLQTMTHQDQSLYLFLALAADCNGVSFYRKEKACNILGLDFGEFEVARDRLITMGLIAFQTYSALSVNGFYQLLPVDGRPPDFASARPAAP